jgi:hypothetical protein
LPRLAEGKHRLTVTVAATKVTSAAAKSVVITVG